MSDAPERAAAAAETLTRLATESAAREQVWRERAEKAQSDADAALERERAAAQVSRDALVEAARAQAIAVLAAALVRADADVVLAIRMARDALFGADAAPATSERCPHYSDCDGERTCPPGFRGLTCEALPMPCDDCALYPRCEDGDLEPPDPGQPCARKVPICDPRTKAEGGPR